MAPFVKLPPSRSSGVCRALAWLGALAAAATVPLPAFPDLAAQPVPEFAFDQPADALVAAAEKAGMPATGLAVPDAVDAHLRPGDSIIALVVHAEGRVKRQWLVQLAAKELSAEEQKLPPLPQWSLFTSTGNEHVFRGERAAIAIHILGPVVIEERKAGNPARPPRRIPDKWSGTFVNSEFLGLGFDRGSAAWLRMGAYSEANGQGGRQMNWGARTTPFPPEETAAGREKAALFGMTSDDERALVAMLPALVQFLQIASQTPGLHDIFMSVVDVPVWSIVGNLGKAPDFGVDFLPRYARTDPTPWGLAAEAEAYEMSFILRMNSIPALSCRMVVVAPRPPLLTSAGIVGIAAQKPDGKGPRLMIRVVASRRARADS